MNGTPHRSSPSPGRGSTRLVLGGVIAWTLSLPAAGHHSFANFDLTKTVTLRGTVKELQWTNPHCFVQLLVPGATGSVEWSLEMNSPLAEYRLGWRPHLVKAGDKLTATVNPARNGTPSGRLLSATDANGRPLGKAQTSSDKGAT